MYSFSYGSLRFFFLGADEGRAGPKSSSSEEESSIRVRPCAHQACGVYLPSFACAAGCFRSWSSASISARERLGLLGDSDPLEAMTENSVFGGVRWCAGTPAAQKLKFVRGRPSTRARGVKPPRVSLNMVNFELRARCDFTSMR